jgi:hypothetical protein
MTRRIPTYLAALGLTVLLLSGCASETDASNAPAATQGTNTNLYSDGAVWQGNVCMARTKSGKQVRVSPSNCPPKPVE